MNMNKRHPVALGIFLIVLGVVWSLNLWWALWPGALAVAGVLAYNERRRLGRPIEAVQAGLWCIGLSILFLIEFVWPGLLFLAGASLLARSRELAIDDWIQRLVTRVHVRSNAQPVVQQVPVITIQPPVPARSEGQPTLGETMRLK